MFLGPLWVRSYTPPLARLGKHPIHTKATTPRQANRDLDSNLCSVVCVCSAFPILLLGRHQYNCLPNHPLPFHVSPL